MTHIRAQLRPGKMARAAMAVAGLALATACAPSDFLDVSDPDIIDPTQVNSPAGARAVRVGALSRFAVATSGGESLFLLGGLFSDEWNNGDTYIDRQQIDQRNVNVINTFLTTTYREAHRARVSGEQAAVLLKQYDPNGAKADVAEMYFVQAFMENMMAEHFCNGLVFSPPIGSDEVYGSQVSTAEAFERALAHADSGLALITGTTAADNRIKYALQVTRGRILLNLDRAAEAATAVAGVPTNFAYEVLHAQTTTNNTTWVLNNQARRYSLSTLEGGNGLPFATAGDPRLPACLGGTAQCTAAGVTSARRDDDSQPLYVQLKWPTRETPVAIATGIEARLIEAEAALASNAVSAFLTLNTLRADKGLPALVPAATAAGREDQLFDERAFWLFGTGHRTGDLRRLVRDYQRAPETVFPTGAWHKGGFYGTDVNLPIPQAEENNPKVDAGKTCTDRVA